MFKFGPSLAEHGRGREGCRGCRWDRPRACGCGGLVHVEYDDHPERPFLYHCDRCSADATPVGDEI